MPTITYDPILETAEPPQARPVPPRTALVLETARGARVLLHREQFPERQHAGRRSHLVDLAIHGLAMEARLPSRDPSFGFDAMVSFSCQVTNPIMVATNGIRDVTAAVRPRLVKILRAVAQRYDVHDVAVAEAALNSALDRHYGNSALRLGLFTVELETDDLAPVRAISLQA